MVTPVAYCPLDATAPTRNRSTGSASSRPTGLGDRCPEGFHAQLKHATRGGRVNVPLHPGEIIGPGLLRAILAQAGVTAEEFRAAL
jgi:hypothetical protein